ncbi:MAG: class I SAM-dependent methyltransferase, partial [Acidobacteriota bacterium]
MTKRIRRRWYLHGLLYDLLLEWMLRSIKKKVALLIAAGELYPVLDVCCGTGRQCRFLAGRGKPVFGLDINLRLMNYAHSRHPQISFICADASRIPFSPSSLKGIVISFALHEKPLETRPQILTEAKTLLRPGGR